MAKRSGVASRHKTRFLAASLALGVGLLGAGAGVTSGSADAARVAGASDAPGVTAGNGATRVKVTLSQGAPDYPGEYTGSVVGVTINLDRVKGIDPTSAADREKVRNASMEQVRSWGTDLHVEGQTDANGNVIFDNLARGIYLVTSQAPAGANPDAYRQINPFLVAVPFHTVAENSNPVEGVIVAKTREPGVQPTTPPSTSPGTPPGGTLPGKPGTGPGASPGARPGTSPGGSSGDSADARGTHPGAGSDAADSPDSQGRDRTYLPMTGAAVIGLVIAAAILIGAGVAFVAFSRRREAE